MAEVSITLWGLVDNMRPHPTTAKLYFRVRLIPSGFTFESIIFSVFKIE